MSGRVFDTEADWRSEVWFAKSAVLARVSEF